MLAQCSHQCGLATNDAAAAQFGQEEDQESKNQHKLQPGHRHAAAQFQAAQIKQSVSAQLLRWWPDNIAGCTVCGLASNDAAVHFTAVSCIQLW
jgi:hypothetical protein